MGSGGLQESQSLQLFSSKSVKLPHKEGFFTKFTALAQCARSTVVSPTNRDRLREEAEVVLKRRCYWLVSKTENSQLEKKSARKFTQPSFKLFLEFVVKREDLTTYILVLTAE